MMRHLDDTTALKLALDEATDEERSLVRGHLESCARCRARVEEMSGVWSRLDADPARSLPDAPMWPRVARALEEADRGATVLRPVWKLALSEAARSPLAYAALLVVALGIGGGHVAGRALLGDEAATTAAVDILDYTALAGLPDGSLAVEYLGEDLYQNGAGENEEVQP